jgi:hypothetical protein
MGQTKKCAGLRKLDTRDPVHREAHARAQTRASGVETVE